MMTLNEDCILPIGLMKENDILLSSFLEFNNRIYFYAYTIFIFVCVCIDVDVYMLAPRDI